MDTTARTLQARGTGHIELPPDLLVLSLDLTNQHKEYDKALLVGRQLREILQETLAPAGITADDLKILRFSVLPRRVNVRRYEDNDHYENRYECEQLLELRLPLDLVHLQRILALCAASLASPGVRIYFELDDPDAAKDAAFAAAVQDAQRKARAVARAAGVQIGDILRIDVGDKDSDLDLPLPIGCYGAAAPDAASSAPPAPKDLSIDANVSVLWAIS
ncbi:MAG: SIMPL domain-containing protein [Selenomonadaceae bacterium]|nr:SIMPL domain-containing protein [Selenomonadaceae bacterium]